MENKYPHVMSPVRIRGHLIKNRIITGPSTVHTASDGEPFPTEEAMMFFEDRARAGAGIVTVTGVSTAPAEDNGIVASWDLYQKNHTHKLAQLAERIHFYGAKASMELMGIFPNGYTVSDGCSIMGSPPIGREIPVEEMMKFRDNYAFAAGKIKELGYDGLLFHFGHGIPVAQFLSPYTNKRTDEYGGSTENRCRYIVEILDAVRKAVGNDMFIEVRISGDERQEGGIDLQEGLRIGEILQEHCDILQTSAGMHDPEHMTITHPCGFLPPMPNIYIAEAFKKSDKIHVPITAIGAVPDLQAAEEILAAGKADFVTMARTFIADIDMMKKCLSGHREDVRPCVKCMVCHDTSGDGIHMRCTVNPQVGLQQHIKRMIEPPQRVKKVAVIGGGPAGMQAALTAAERGHSVVLFEKSGSLGGKLKFAEYVSFKYPLAGFKNWLIRQIEKSGVQVLLNTEAVPGDMEGFDAVICAVGSEPVILSVPGIEKAVTAIEIYGHEENVQDTAAIIGGGQVGCETALHLAMLGKRVTVLEMRDSLAPDALPTQRDELLLKMREQENLSVILSGRCLSVENDGVMYEKDGEKRRLYAGSVILSAGMRGLTALADTFMGLTDEFAQAGDCVKARTVEQAVKEGYFAAVRL